MERARRACKNEDMNRVEVNPALLRWARERAGLSTEAMEARFPRIVAWERGETRPTLKQLERFAKATFTPVGFLFLPEPPVERVPIRDFRTVANTNLERPSPDLLDTIYLCQQRQNWYHDFARSTGEEQLGFVGAARLADGITKTAAGIRHTLGFDVEERRRLPTWTDALRQFVTQADAVGILVMVSGVVGSNTRRRLNPREFRGFALVDQLAPLVFVNGADTKAAQMFTLAHELAHVWLGQSGVSDTQAAAVPDQAIERWCNRVAAEVLVPLDLLRAEYDRSAELYSEIRRLARRFKVSTLVVLRRVHDAGGLARAELRSAYAEELARLQSTPAGSGGNFYLTVGARVGRRFARAVIARTLEGQTSFPESFRLLGCRKMKTFNELADNLNMGF